MLGVGVLVPLEALAWGNYRCARRSRGASTSIALGVARQRPCPAPDCTAMSSTTPPAVRVASLVVVVVCLARSEMRWWVCL